MATVQRNFADYELGDNVYQLADELIPKMAVTMGYTPGKQPSESSLSGLVGHIGPAKWLQENIDTVRERLGTSGDACTVAADWVDRSGVLVPVRRSFASPELAVPTEVDNAVISGGVARWMLRRAETISIHANENQIGRVYLPMGNREMKVTEHDLVEEFATREGRLPTERDFAATYIVSILKKSGLAVEMFEPDTADGDEIMTQLVSGTAITDGSVLVVSNAPAAIQSAGQFRLAARAAHGSFDDFGDQLYMISDVIEVARRGEGPATHQNPYTALGQIARNALFLQRNQ